MHTTSPYRIAQHAVPNQEHRFQYDLALLAGGSATVSVQQLVGSTYQNLPSTQTQSTSGTYTLAFAPTEATIRIVVASTNRFALTNLTLDRDHVDTLVESYALHAGGYRYGFQGQEKDDEISGKGNSYTAEFWQYDSRLGRRWNIDPVVKPHRSSYDVLSNNPIIMIDPNGANDYKVDKKGNISLKKETSDDFDRVIGRIKWIKKSIIIEKGIISSNSNHNIAFEREVPTDEDLKNKQLISYNINMYIGPTAEMQALFEFFASTTNVEWGLFKFNEGGVYPHSILTTSHDESTDVSGKLIINDPLFKNSDFNGHDHNHPGGSGDPSGYLPKEVTWEGDNPIVKLNGDVGFANSLIQMFMNKVLIFRIYISKPNPETGKKYKEYDNKTIFDEK